MTSTSNPTAAPRIGIGYGIITRLCIGGAIAVGRYLHHYQHRDVVGTQDYISQSDHEKEIERLRVALQMQSKKENNAVYEQIDKLQNTIEEMNNKMSNTYAARGVDTGSKVATTDSTLWQEKNEPVLSEPEEVGDTAVTSGTDSTEIPSKMQVVTISHGTSSPTSFPTNKRFLFESPNPAYISMSTNGVYGPEGPISDTGYPLRQGVTTNTTPATTTYFENTSTTASYGNASAGTTVQTRIHTNTSLHQATATHHTYGVYNQKMPHMN